MNESTKDIWRGRWKQRRGKIQETWGDLTGDELDQLAGQRDQLVGRIQEKTGQAENEIREKIESLEKECASA